MREERIVIEPFKFISYLDFRSFKALENHGMVRVRGIVDRQDAERYMEMAKEELHVKVILQEGDMNYVFFRGIITGISVKVENGLCILEFEAKSGSFLADIHKHVRSFQQDGTEFGQIADTCLAGYPDASCNWNRGKSEKTDGLVMQYEETDWDFLRRICSKRNLVIFPDNRADGIKIRIGIQKTGIRRLESECYSLETDSAGDTYVVTDREAMEIGEFVSFQGMEMCICKVITGMKGNELYHRYYLRHISVVKPKAGENSKLQGCSLEADVLAVEGDMVKVRIMQDENGDACGSRWFPYATVYSTPDGTGWYCMPEVGDRVRVSFPDGEEWKAYAASAVHVGNSRERNNPDHKSFMNRQRKEVLFTPESIVLRNNKGMEIVLRDGEGIRIVSDRDIILQAENEIRVTSSGSSIAMQAESTMSMQQGGAMLSLGGTIKMTGGKINMN